MFQFFDLLILLAIAVFIISRLYNILGQVDEDQEKPKKNNVLIDMILGKIPVNKMNAVGQKNSISQAEIIDISEASLSEELRQKIAIIKRTESNFSLDKFLQGVRNAYSMINSAKNNHNIDILSHLLYDDLYKKVQNQLNQQNEKKQKMIRNILNIRNIEIKDIEFQNHNDNKQRVIISVSIQNNQTYVLKDELGNILDGNEDRIITSLDQWKFTKVIGTNESTWLLIEEV